MCTHLTAGERRPFQGEMGALAAFSRNAPRAWTSTAFEGQQAATVEFYERVGGLARTDDMLELMRRKCSQPISLLARWIVSQRVVCFEWRSQWLLPKFQFDLDDLSIRPAVSAALTELAGTFDGWELATWFMERNVWLEDRSPMDVLDGDLQPVRAAARADRFIARG